MFDKNILIDAYEKLPHEENNSNIKDFTVEEWFNIKYYTSAYNDEIKLLAKLIDQSVPPVFEVEILNETFIVFEPWVKENCLNKTDFDVLHLFNDRYNPEYVDYYYGLYLNMPNRNVQITELEAGEGKNYFNVVFLFLLINLIQFVQSQEISMDVKSGDNPDTLIKLKLVDDCKNKLKEYQNGVNVNMLKINNNYNVTILGETLYACHYNQNSMIIRVKNKKFTGITSNATHIKAVVNLHNINLKLINKLLSYTTNKQVNISPAINEVINTVLNTFNPIYKDWDKISMWGIGGGALSVLASVYTGGPILIPFLSGFSSFYLLSNTYYQNTNDHKSYPDLLNKHNDAISEITSLLKPSKKVVWIEDYMFEASINKAIQRNTFNAYSINDVRVTNYKINYDIWDYYEMYGYITPVALLSSLLLFKYKRGGWNYNKMSGLKNIVEESLLYDYVDKLQDKTIKEIKDNSNMYNSLELFDKQQHAELNWKWDTIKKDDYISMLKVIINNTRINFYDKNITTDQRKEKVIKLINKLHNKRIDEYKINISAIIDNP